MRRKYCASQTGEVRVRMSRIAHPDSHLEGEKPQEQEEHWLFASFLTAGMGWPCIQLGREYGA